MVNNSTSSPKSPSDRSRRYSPDTENGAIGTKPELAYRTLLIAERTAPGEIRTRNAVRRLVTDLIASPRQAAMPGLPALAALVQASV